MRPARYVESGGPWDGATKIDEDKVTSVDRMSPRSRLTVGFAAVLLVLLYIFPIWKISLDAPQYPEGLGMYIRINDVSGVQKGNLESINGLNHYIGMKEITPDSIPELRIMPWIVAGLMVVGLIAAATGRRQILYVWVGLFLLVAIAGLIDFYLWGYDYGHNLDVERAIIKVPGMTYQPPLVGVKQLLNIRAASWPWVGGWAAFASLGLGGWVMIQEMKKRYVSGSADVRA